MQSAKFAREGDPHLNMGFRRQWGESFSRDAEGQALLCRLAIVCQAGPEQVFDLIQDIASTTGADMEALKALLARHSAKAS